MKNLYLILALLSLLTCKSTDVDKPPAINFKIWGIESYNIGKTTLIPSQIKEGYVIYNNKTKKSYIHYILSDKTTKELEKLWIKGNKKLKLEQINLVQEITYIQDGSKLTIKSIKSDYIIKGEHTEKIIEKINSIVYSERAGESSGAITLLYRIWNPDIIHQMPFPDLKKKDVFFLDFNKGTLHLKNNLNTIKITLKDEGIHQWLGY